MSAPLRIIFAGTPDFAVPALQALIASEHDVVAVYTQPDRPAGRGREPRPSPVKQLALEYAVPVNQPVSLKTSAEQASLRALAPDLIVVVAYGLLLPQAVLDIPRFGCINIHASLLPRWRGAAPIQRAILAGDSETGITIMQMDAGLDTGDMLCSAACEIRANDTGASLHDRLMQLGATTLMACLPGLFSGEIVPRPQDDRDATYAAKLSKQEAEIDGRSRIPAGNSRATRRTCVSGRRSWAMNHRPPGRGRRRAPCSPAHARASMSPPATVCCACCRCSRRAAGSWLWPISLMHTRWMVWCWARHDAAVGKAATGCAGGTGRGTGQGPVTVQRRWSHQGSAVRAA